MSHLHTLFKQQSSTKRPSLTAVLSLVLLLCSLSCFLTGGSNLAPLNAGFTGQLEHLVFASNSENIRIPQAEDRNSDDEPDLPVWLLSVFASFEPVDAHSVVPLDTDPVASLQATSYLHPLLRAPPLV